MPAQFTKRPLLDYRRNIAISLVDPSGGVWLLTGVCVNTPCAPPAASPRHVLHPRRKRLPDVALPNRPADVLEK